MIRVQEMFGKLKKMKTNLLNCLVFFLLSLILAASATAQVKEDRCGTMTLLSQELAKKPALKDSMINATRRIREAVKNRTTAPSNARVEATPIYIPVVFHIVMSDPSVITDQQINEQIDVLNKDYAGLNADSTNIPSYFKPYFGKGRVQFALAKRNASNAASTGIDRVTSSKSQFSETTDDVKHASSGGANAWDASRFFNVWVCTLRSGLLGYATFTYSASNSEQGVVISYTTLPGGSATNYNQGRTLTHESGHFFNLYHIWGDDNGACTDDDGIDDTPNQANSTSGCPSGMKTDACATASPGIMYQNYMDYSSDGCMVMFTTEQVATIDSVLTRYRSGLTTSNGATSPLKTLDAQMVSIDQPYNRVCDTKFIPVITFRNYGQDTLRSLDISASVDGGTQVTTHWDGILASLSTAQVTLNTSSFNGYGAHSIKIRLSAPNGGADLDASNDTLSLAFSYPTPVNPPVTEGFENTTFPSSGWDIVNGDKSYTWERTTNAAKTGSASMVIRNFDYTAIGQRDYLRLPATTITNADSAFLSFEVAAAVKTTSTLFNDWDTLQVLASTDCGVTYTSLYKKYGATLATRSGAVTTSFVPGKTEWRKDSVDLTAYINKGPLLIAFVNASGNENNIYVDDINLYKISSNVTLAEQGWSITPNPTTGPLTIQFSSTPANLKGIVLYNSAGQQVAEALVNGSAATSYEFNMMKFASGVYVVRIVYSDHVISRKVIKR